MKTTVIHLEGIESVLSTAGVEKKMCKHSGIHKVETNFMTGTATVYHDDSVTLAEIKQCVADCGYHCAGEAAPVNIVKPGDPPAASMAHSGHVMPATKADEQAEHDTGEHASHAMPMPTAKTDEHAGHDMAAMGTEVGEMDAMAHEMGHGGGM